MTTVIAIRELDRDEMAGVDGGGSVPTSGDDGNLTCGNGSFPNVRPPIPDY
jgi:hypothetical protein